ncbi:MAG: hypothetical protein GY806_07990 [Gammaproteobacteria bacterium]|nr:hypothetical protein [Gammaproteobacteria bacterium]
MNKVSLFLIMLIVIQGVSAAELFGLQLKTSTLDQLRTAVKNAGATIIFESDEHRPYDVFDSKKILPGSSRLYIGHVGENRQTAFVEYEFPGLRQAGILEMLSSKYGNPAVRKGKFLSDKHYFWELNGVRITLWKDWENYRTLLSYALPEVMSDLQSTSQGMTIDSSLY